ncbi:SDR family oxidoreductase [Aquabacterium sp.]|uniref:SDR family oxidoreductase n=1 Tax=Aquabacterium sp. TaxID=1872578 RepID=UPI003784D670
MNVQHKVVIVTGGASGIGLALCRRFAQAGARAVVVADLDPARCQAVADEVSGLGSQGLAVPTDVSREPAIQALVQQATERFGQVDVFCSNAGIIQRGGMEATLEQWQRIHDINVMAHVFAARAVLPQMLARGEGYLVNTASAAGLLAQVDSAMYTVTKHAAVAFAEWLAINYGDKSIRVSCLCPQGVRTPMLLGADGQRKSFLSDGSVSAEQVADEVLRCMQEERFLILPHPEVLTYLQRKAADVERWIRGMRRVRDQAESIRAQQAQGGAEAAGG